MASVVKKITRLMDRGGDECNYYVTTRTTVIIMIMKLIKKMIMMIT